MMKITLACFFGALSSVMAGQFPVYPAAPLAYSAYPYAPYSSLPLNLPAYPALPLRSAPLVTAPVFKTAAPAALRAFPAVPAAVPAAPLVKAAPLAAPLTAAVPVAAAKIDTADAYPQYTYAYNIQDTLTGDSKAQEESREGDVVKGRYSLIEADGSRRVVNYYADPLNGFNAIVQKELPVAVAPVKAAPAIISV